MRRLGGERRRFLTTLGLFIALFRSLRVRRGRGGVTIAFLSRFCGFGFRLTFGKHVFDLNSTGCDMSCTWY